MFLSVTVPGMEAAAAEKEVGMTEWNDGGLDDLSKRVGCIETKMDAGFANVDRKFKEVERKMDNGFARIDGKFDVVHQRLDGLQRSLTQIAWTFGIGMLAFAAALIGLIATKF